jgi:hypothetical protein
MATLPVTNPTRQTITKITKQMDRQRRNTFKMSLKSRSISDITDEQTERVLQVKPTKQINFII